jgi:hypothetical protein
MRSAPQAQDDSRPAPAGRNSKMAEGSQTKVTRTLHLKFTLPTADPSQLQAFIKAAAPYYELFGGRQIRLLQNVDSPSQFIQVFDYDVIQSLEDSRQQMASDPRMQAFLQSWRQMFPGSVEVCVFREIAV